MLGEFAEVARDRYRLASEVHGNLGVSVEDFEAHLRRIAERCLGGDVSEDAETQFLRSLHTNDLLLTVACARGSDAGWRRFHASYRKYLSDVTRRLLGGTPGLEEIGEGIWIDLFLPDRSGQSRIASYDGRSSLATWLRVVVSNRVINERQRRSFSAGDIEAIPEPVDPSALTDVEARLRRSRYQTMIVGAFKQALASLETREALLVLLRYDQGLQLGEVARLFDVHQSTITRQLDRIVERLRNQVVARLKSDYFLDAAQIEECLSVACDTFSSSLSILGFLRDRTPGFGSTMAQSG